MSERVSAVKKDTNQKVLTFLDPENWRAASPKELIHHYHVKIKSKKYRASEIFFEKYLSPVDVYTYLKARFGEPNGFSNFLKSRGSDNLIHWDYLLICEDVAINIMGANRSVEVIISKNITDDGWRVFVENFRKAYQKHAKKKSEIFKNLEEWSVFINRYSELCSEAEKQYDKIIELKDFKFKTPPIPPEKDMMDEWNEQFDGLTNNFHELQQACLNLKLLTPILVEAFINLLILVLCKKEIRENKRIYDARIREDLHIKISSLHLTCDKFSKPVDTNSAEYKNFHSIMNNRNWFFHGNADPYKDRLETVYFEKNTPLYKTPGNLYDKYFGALLNMIRPTEVLEDYIKAHEFIIHVVNCIEQEHQEQIWFMLESNRLGYNEKEKRFGVLFSNSLYSMLLPEMKTDEGLFSGR